MDVDRACQKRKHAQRETHQEAEKIEIRPGHKSPRARHYFAHLAVALRELRFETRTFKHLRGPPRAGSTSISKWRNRRRMTPALLVSRVLVIAGVQDFSETLS